MHFTGQELAAVMKLAIAMVSADGHSSEKEMEVVKNELKRFGASVDQMLALTREAQQMQPDVAISIISNFDFERKKYVASYLAVIMIADGEIDDKENALWQMASFICNLPEMNVMQAVENMNSL
ncbi:MAG: TerB family tellurite resistance protein [Bacteroidaceae bacterium]|nr:TerB family tellurite resistance protein [Bacteroidaceae bacterium]